MTSQVHTLTGAYALDAVDESERATVERHLSECDECAQEVRELQATAARLSDVTITEPPARMRDNVLAQVRRTRQDPPEEDSPQAILQPRRIGSWRKVAVGGVTAVVLALIASVVTFVIMQEQVSQERARQDEISAVLTAEDAEVFNKTAEGGGRVTVIASASHDEAVVVMSGLADVTTERAYQLWLVNDAGQTSAGVMPAGDRSATMLVAGISDADVIGVTNEPAGGSDTPTLPMVADVELAS